MWRYMVIYGGTWSTSTHMKYKKVEIQLYTVLKKGIGQLLYCHSSRGTKHSSGAYEHA